MSENQGHHKSLTQLPNVETTKNIDLRMSMQCADKIKCVSLTTSYHQFKFQRV